MWLFPKGGIVWQQCHQYMRHWGLQTKLTAVSGPFCLLQPEVVPPTWARVSWNVVPFADNGCWPCLCYPISRGCWHALKSYCLAFPLSGFLNVCKWCNASGIHVCLTHNTALVTMVNFTEDIEGIQWTVYVKLIQTAEDLYVFINIITAQICFHKSSYWTIIEIL